eukprot:TRINITY_DN1012_c1_g1_i2.p1 TRINITY_DN1012_c1_g1~~TRINITY_DN1012_c1_g1_i2.p1  ORF type:complete len:559 (-),score=93.00 TRINITY_DN1012_c1_g1_i2:98-1774(-)
MGSCSGKQKYSADVKTPGATGVVPKPEVGCKRNDSLLDSVHTADSARDQAESDEKFGAVLTSQACRTHVSDFEDKDVNHARLIYDNPGRIAEHYDIDLGKLGQGSFGKVRKAQKRDTSSVRAIKSCSKKDPRTTRRFRLEIDIMKCLDHPNIMKLFETFEDSKRVHLVMEYCVGGSVADQFHETGPWTEVQVTLILQQIFRAVYFLQGCHIVHRDIKPENFLLQTNEPVEENTLKLIDFGLSTRCPPDGWLTTTAGTPVFTAPQVFNGKYDQACDLWSCGVTMYYFLCGELPFQGKSQAEVVRAVKSGNYAFSGKSWKRVSDVTKDLVRDLLKYNPTERCTAQQALKHESMTRAPRARAESVFRPALAGKFRKFCSQNRLKRAALHIVAHQLDQEDTKALRDTFTALDFEDDGVLSHTELEEGLAKAMNSAKRDNSAITREEVEQNMADMKGLLNEISKGVAAIGYTEFLAATLESEHYTKDQAILSAFSVFDRDGDGRISGEELEQVLGCRGRHKLTSSSTIPFEDIFKELDYNQDGYIDFMEFRDMMCAGGKPKVN